MSPRPVTGTLWQAGSCRRQAEYKLAAHNSVCCQQACLRSDLLLKDLLQVWAKVSWLHLDVFVQLQMEEHEST